MEYLNLDTDNTLGGDNPSDTKVSSQKATREFITKDRIEAGTIIEGKFSELPQFFESLEGKYCNGTVTYKIIEDETVSIQEVITIPSNSIKNVVIDFDEHTISCTYTCVNDISDYIIKIVSSPYDFCSLLLKNGNFVGNSTVYQNFLTLENFKNVYIDSISCTHFCGQAIRFNNCVIGYCNNSEFVGDTIGTTYANAGISCNATLLSESRCIYNNVGTGIVGGQGSIIKSSYSTFSSIIVSCIRAVSGSVCVINTASTSTKASYNQSFNTGIAYN